jgi:hypothetical protein
VQRGDKVGTLKLTLDDRPFGDYPVLAESAIEV